MCLRDQGIDNNDGGVGIVRRACGPRYDNEGVDIGRRVRNTSERSETKTEATGAIQQA